MSDRISCEEIARVMDRIRVKLDIRVPNKLHRLVAARTGVHPTTVLRYLQGTIESADARILGRLLELERHLDEGGQVLTDEEAAVLHTGSGSPEAPYRLSSRGVQRLIDDILDLLENPDPSILYHHLGERLGIDPATIMRHHAGGGAGAADDLVPVLRELEASLRRNELVVLIRTDGEPGRLVPRRSALELLEEIRSMSLIAEEMDLEPALERLLGLGAGELRDLDEPTPWPFVRYESYMKLLRLRDCATYDPSHWYDVGDRIHHHSLGGGTVVAKLHKSRIVVKFDSGARRLLCEGVNVDPRLPLRMN